MQQQWHNMAQTGAASYGCPVNVKGAMSLKVYRIENAESAIQMSVSAIQIFQECDNKSVFS